MELPGAPNATLLERFDASEAVAVFRIRPDAAPPEGSPRFEAGQHTALSVAAPHGRWLSRPYSVASPPEERRFVAIAVRRSTREQDDFVETLFALPAGARVHVSPRFSGEITLEQTGAGDGRVLLFVAAGTGIAPFASILRSLARRPGGAGPGVALLHGARVPGELLFREELEGVLGTRYLPTLSGDDPAWRGPRGRVELLLDDSRIGAVEAVLGLPGGGLSPRAAAVFVCGHRETISGVCSRLARRGFAPSDRIAREVLGVPSGTPPSLFFEYFGSDPLFDPSDLEAIGTIRSSFPRA